MTITSNYWDFSIFIAFTKDNENDATHKSEINANMAFTQSLSPILKCRTDIDNNVKLIKNEYCDILF